VVLNKNKMACAVSSLLASNKTIFFCKLPKTPFFTTLDVQVLRDGRMLYTRCLNAENFLFLDPPRNLTVMSSGKEGSFYGSEFEIDKRCQTAKEDQSFLFLFFFLTDVDPLIVLLVLFIGLTLCLLSLTVILSHHKFFLKKLWPDIPTPEHKFPGLFTVNKGDFKEWMSQNNGSMWGRSVHVYTEELPSLLEVLSEVSLTSHGTSQREEEEEKESERSDSGLTDRWRDPPHAHWLMEQLRALQENPESRCQSSLLQSHDTYVTLNQGDNEQQVDDVFEETLPLQTLFTTAGTSSLSTSHSDLGSLQQSSGSGRLSSQSSFEYPNHIWPPKGPGYAYMAVADSGVSMDYSPMSSSRIAELGRHRMY
uniref:Erythropoietin receptor-like n=1 Tax=Sinocyclocheilus grahami TaxID=75366 RepID=A0A672K0M7_SINGR